MWESALTDMTSDIESQINASLLIAYHVCAGSPMPPKLASAAIDVGRVESFSLASQPKLELHCIKTHTSTYLLRCQLYDQLVTQALSSGIQWRRYCQKGKKPDAVAQTLGRSLMLQLHAMKGCDPRTGTVVVLTLSQAMGALKRAKVPAVVIKELQAAVLQPCQPVSAPSQSGPQHLDIDSLQLCDDLPRELPKQAPSIKLGQQLSLKQHEGAYLHPVLQAQLGCFTEFFNNDWNLVRDTNTLGGRSISGIKDDILYILGYLHTVLGIELPNLYHLVQAEHICVYLASRFNAGLAQGSMGHDLDAVTKVVQFWKGQKGLGSAAQKLQELEVWMHRLAKQMRKARPQVRKEPFAMQASGQWATAAELVQCFEAARQKTVPEVHEWLEEHDGRMMGMYLALELQDVALANTLFGYLPPMRLECIKTMTRPGAGVGCQEEECTLGPDCAGNRLEWKADGGLKIVFPHHKNRKTWGTAITLEDLPAELTEVLELYLEHAIPTFCSKYPKVQEHGRVFFTPTGLPHTGSLSYHFRRILQSFGMPRALAIAPQTLRHIFIDERSAASPVAGPNDRDASLVMGNSVAAWGAWYQLSRWDGRAAQRAADQMQPWRAAMLQQSEPLQLESTVMQESEPLQLEGTVMPEFEPMQLDNSPASELDEEDVNIVD